MLSSGIAAATETRANALGALDRQRTHHGEPNAVQARTLVTSVEYTHMISNRSSLPSNASDAECRGKFPPFTIWTYVLREHAGPFIFAFVVIFFILVIDLLVDIMDAILGKGLAASTVLELFMLNFAWMIALAVPMAVLVSVLMAFGRMANDNELIALMAAGISPISLVMPVVLASSILAVGMVWFNNNILPDSNYRARLLMANLQRTKPAVNLIDREGIFITDFPNHILRIDRVELESASPTGPFTGSRLEGIVVYEFDEGAQDPATVITAKTGTIELWQGGATMRLTLFDGEMIQIDRSDKTRDLQTRFEQQTIIMTDRRRDLTADSWRSSGYRNDRELSASDMRDRIAMYRKQIEESRTRIGNLASDTALRG
jgi:lipopolysaccharide export system permease protein